MEAVDPDVQLARYFVNAEPPRNKFEAVLTAKDQSRILSIEGGVGSGKSALLAMYRLRCKALGFPVALANGDTAKDPVGVLEMLANDLRQSGIQVNRFEPLLKTYQAVRRIVTDRSQGVAETGTAARPAVFSEGIVDALSTLSLSPDDIELYREGAARLTKEFLQDVAQTAQANRIVLMIDRWEMFGSTETSDWFRDWLLAMPDNVLVVISGRKALPSEQFWSSKWPTWPTYVWSYPLKALIQEDGLLLIERFAKVLTEDKAAPSSDLASQIWQWSRGIPELLCFAVRFWHTHGSTEFDDSQALVVRGAYDLLLEGTSPELKSILQTAAIFRSFTRESLRATAMPGQTEEAREELFKSAFLEPKGNEWTIPQHLRDTLNGKLRIDESERYAEMHQKASQYCESRESKLLSSARSEGQRRELERWELERLYHQFEENKAQGVAAFQRSFEDAFFSRRDFDFCRALLNEFCSYALDTGAKQLVAFYQGLMAIYLEADPNKSVGILETLRLQKLDGNLRAEVLEYLAAIYWYYNQVDKNGTEKASGLYDECLALREANGDTAGQARVKIWMGILAQRTRGEGEPKFRQALALCELLPDGREPERIRAWANQELSIGDRMAGRFTASGKLIDSTIKTFQKLEMPFDAAGARFNHAMLLIWRGRLREAEAELNTIEQLYQKSPRSRIQEKAWISIGFGNIALGRRSFGEAARRFGSVAQLGTEKSDRFVTSLGLGGQAECCIAEGQWDQALTHAGNCLALQDESKDMFGAGWTRHSLGLAHAAKLDFARALECLDQGRRLMREYGSRFGESRLLTGMCQVYAQQEDRQQFQKAATGVRDSDPPDRFYDHLTQVAFLEGKLALTDAKPVREPSLCFAEALGAATEYGPFLLDWILAEILGVLKSVPEPRRIEILNDVSEVWASQGMPDREKLRRSEEAAPEQNRISLLERIHKEYPEVRIDYPIAKAPAEDYSRGRLEASQGKTLGATAAPPGVSPADLATASGALSADGDQNRGTDKMHLEPERPKTAPEDSDNGGGGSWKYTKVVAAAIAAISTIVVAYWQFGNKPGHPADETVQLRVLVEGPDENVVEKAEVHLEDGTHHLDVTTDQNGLTKTLPVSKAGSGTVTLTVRAPNFQPTSRNVDRPVSDETETVYLKHQETPPVPSHPTKSPAVYRLAETWDVQAPADPSNARMSNGTFTFSPQLDGSALVKAHFLADGMSVTLDGKCGVQGHEVHMSFNASTAQGGSWEGTGDLLFDSPSRLTGRIQSKRGDDLPFALIKP